MLEMMVLFSIMGLLFICQKLPQAQQVQVAYRQSALCNEFYADINAVNLDLLGVIVVKEC